MILFHCGIQICQNIYLVRVQKIVLRLFFFFFFGYPFNCFIFNWRRASRDFSASCFPQSRDFSAIGGTGLGSRDLRPIRSLRLISRQWWRWHRRQFLILFLAVQTCFYLPLLNLANLFDFYFIYFELCYSIVFFVIIFRWNVESTI